MFNIIQIELWKFVRRKKFIISLALLMVVCVFCILSTIVAAPKTRGITNEIKRTKDYINILEEQGNLQKDKGASEAVNKGYSKIINDQKEKLIQLEKLADENVPWQERVKQDISYSKQYLEKNWNLTPVAQYQERINIMKKQYYLDNNMPYDYNESIKSFEDMPAEMRIFGLLGLLIIAGIMVVDIVSGENKPATIKLLLTKPIERRKVVLSKFIVSFFVVNGVILLFELIIFIAIGGIFGFGNSSLPAVAGTRYTAVSPEYANELKSIVIPNLSSTFLISSGNLIVKILVIQILAVTASIAFCFLCSTVIENSNISTGVAVFFMGFTHALVLLKHNGFMYRVQPPTIIDKISAFIFTTYYDGQAVVNGDINMKLGLDFISYRYVLVILIVWIVLCYGISHLVFVRKDITS
ncbi:hypothetical protein HMPREF1982_02445 [Clostridiales bacterium oral taxon 876 str. F0540]|nr:hypothetical protein HMPREF1982_02445 [Clostridiales bacterium oral taxon 876 str. F0540]